VDTAEGGDGEKDHENRDGKSRHQAPPILSRLGSTIAAGRNADVTTLMTRYTPRKEGAHTHVWTQHSWVRAGGPRHQRCLGG
jgi:hypothetical protein